MIEIRELSKIYRASLDKPCTAIDKLTLDLPSKGMVFITGKSGSGKSTLLNMIGTLDNISRGDIYVESRSVRKFTEKEAQEYRSSYLGFVFQDFLLLDELTVKENIELALNISGITDENVFKDIIKRVDLEGKEDKFPSELSGGQKQRVAIARALIKNPKMLLCDEPTGNLDQRTSKQIFNILKEESKTKLVIVVSHNLIDAENYGDRIIELFEGKILHDYTKAENYINDFTETENYVILPHHKDLTNKDLSVLNNKVKNQTFRIAQNKGGFYNTKEVPIDRGELTLSSSHLSKKNKIKLSSMFFRKNKHGAPYIVLMTTLLISLFYIFQMFISFDGNTALKSHLSKDDISYVKIDKVTEKGTLSASNLLYITDEEIKLYNDNGFKDCFKLYNYNISINTTLMSTQTSTRFGVMMNYNYLNETFGTLACNLEYLVKLYGNENGELTVLAGDITKADTKMIITDYVADSIMIHTKKTYITYDDVVNGNKSKVCAIIETGYKEKYSKVLEDGKKAKEEGLTSNEYLEKYSSDDLHNEFFSDVHKLLGIGYTFSEDIYSHSALSTTSKQTTVLNFHIQKGKKKYFNESMTFNISESLQDGQMIMNYLEYNQIFEAFLEPEDLKDFKPQKIKMIKFDNNQTNGKVVVEKEYEITKLSTSTYVSKNDYLELRHFQYMPFGLYFDHADDLNKLNEISTDLGLYINDIDTGVVPVINTILSLFKTFCLLIIALLFTASFLHVVFYGVNSIRKNIYEIGVLKALGAKSGDISIIFMAQIAIIGVALALTSILGIYLASIFSDSILIAAFEDFLTITIFDLDIIGFNVKIMGLDILVAFVLTIIACIVPLIYLKSIKPLNILKGRNK